MANIIGRATNIPKLIIRKISINNKKSTIQYSNLFLLTVMALF